jgi:uncharacterized membrane protein YhfC
VKRFWLIIAVLCITVGGVFLLRGHLDAAFVVATIGIIAWFLNYRSQMTEIVNAADSEQQEIMGAQNLDDD